MRKAAQTTPLGRKLSRKTGDLRRRYDFFAGVLASAVM
jgi:hypothetical protein